MERMTLDKMRVQRTRMRRTNETSFMSLVLSIGRSGLEAGLGFGVAWPEASRGWIPGLGVDCPEAKAGSVV